MSDTSHITKSTAVKNSIWKLMEAFLSKGISMLVSIVLARLLTPEAYGVIALTTVFINLTDILIQAGFSTTLIRKENVSNEDYSTVFCISLISATVLYAIIFLSAPYIALLYKKPKFTSVLRVISITLFCQAFTAVRTAAITRAMRFRTLFICTIASNIISGITGILLAIFGYGVWALVFQQLSHQVLLTVFLLCTIKIKYTFHVSKKSIKEIAPPSLKILSSSLLSFSGDSLYSVTIGKIYSLKELGFFDKGALFPRTVSLYTFSAVSNVFLPVFASYQNDYDKLNSIFRRVLNVSCYIIFPMMAGLSMVAEPLISVVLTDKWLPAAGILRWNCLYYVATPVLLANVQLHFAIGKNSTRIKAEVVRISLMITMFIGVMLSKVSVTAISAILAIIQIIIAVYMMFETKRATGLKILDIISDIIPSIISVLCMCGAVYLVSLIPAGNFALLIIEIIVGAIVYLLTSMLLKNKAYKEMLSILGAIIKSRKCKHA